MTPLSLYQAALEKDEIKADAAQRQAVECLQELYDVLAERQRSNGGLVGRIKNRIGLANSKAVKGYYFWGGVGRGKTLLVDLFFNTLPFEEKMRMHFHRFMQMVHHELQKLNNTENPLAIVADKIAEKASVICFDEFHVTDITDAMLLSGLLDRLFEQGVTLVATSNEEPDQLYAGGLQRDRFLPAIELIKQNTTVMNIDSGVDYRLQYLDKAEIYHSPLDEQSKTMMLENFLHISSGTGVQGEVLYIEDRPINTERTAAGVVWFEFDAICDGPRGAADYIEIARCFHTVLIANVPVMDDMLVDKVKRFMTLVDEFYDHNVKLILTAEAKPEGLYHGKRLQKPFQRTISRLVEMGSHDYLAKQHLS